MKKFLILGSAGMLGHVVYTYLNELKKYELFDASFPNKFHPDSILLDVTNKAAVEEIISNIKPDIIINCIGILIKGSQQDPSNAIYLNSYLPHQLSKLQRKHGGKLIHISTDCVFTGEKGGYIETDFKDARDTYGLSKALGEVNNELDLTFRTSIIGPELKEQGEGLFHWFRSQKGSINGYTQALWGGVTTLELAKAIDKAINQNLSGLIHLTPGYPISKFDLVSLFKKIWNRTEIEIKPYDGKKVDKSLNTERNDFDFSVKSYDDMLIELFNFMENHRELYKSYLY
jgi:dTDP-4-dehydrorhamnose reductase